MDATTLNFTEGGLYNPYGVAIMQLDGSSTPVTIGGNISAWYIALAGDYVYYYDANLRQFQELKPCRGSEHDFAVVRGDGERMLARIGHRDGMPRVLVQVGDLVSSDDGGGRLTAEVRPNHSPQHTAVVAFEVEDLNVEEIVGVLDGRSDVRPE